MKPYLNVVIAAAVLALPWQVATAQTPAKPAKVAAKKAAPAKAPAKDEEDAIDAEFARGRAMLEEANPAELFEMQGEDLWKAKRGPKNVSLDESCDLGMGVGKVEGAYVHSPRYFADADKVMDIERRVVWCMINKQGFKDAEITAKPFASGSYTPDQTSIMTFLAARSKGMKFDVPLKDPKVKEVYEIGKAVAEYRAGPYDFSCNTCHGADGRRIRMQNLPNISTKKGATRAVQGWPGYRMTGNVMLTSQWRMTDCFRQQRFPEPKYTSDTITSLLTYMAGNANGVAYSGPGIKR